MKPLKKLTVFTLVTAIVLSLFSFSAITGSAVVEIMDGDFSYVRNSDSSYSLYRYYGEAKDITLPDTVFTKSVTAVYFGAFEGSDITSVIIPESYMTISENAFYSCGSLKSVKLPSTVTEIGVSAFSNCTSLDTIEIPDNSSLVTINYSAFSGDTSLEGINLPSMLKKIESNAFLGTGLTSLSIPNSVTEIGSEAFKNCESLETAVLSENLDEIKEDTFSGCKSLSGVVLPEKLKTIGNNAYKGCASMTLSEIPDSVTKIGASAFENATSLTELFISDNVTDIGANAFYPMSIQKTLKVTCYENSYAADYCYENFVEYEAVEKLLGDANLDGVTNILDVSVIQRYKIGEIDIPTSRARALADVNNDGSITIRDATLIQMKLAKIIDEF